jgi:hypothetical protein
VGNDFQLSREQAVERQLGDHSGIDLLVRQDRADHIGVHEAAVRA